ncbi:MAG: CDP-glycerol glycerophosphotransferase family protein [Anaerovoracaceae bacterium]|jgi:CDP-glycerol glycerophosphotransferase
MEQIKAPIRALARRSPAIRKKMKQVRKFFRGKRYRAAGRSVNVDDRTIIFCTFNGTAYADTPRAVYEYLLSDRRFDDCRFFWIFNDVESHAWLADRPRTTLVRNQTKACEEALHRAKYWIFNSRPVDWWIPSPEQVYVQCWHGTPLKKLGYDITRSDNAMNSIEEIREKYRTDAERFRYLLSPCGFSTKVFRTAWNLEEAGKRDAVLELGYPRTDCLARAEEEVRERCRRELGFPDSDRKLILYAPTWRDNQYQNGLGYTYSNRADFSCLRRALGDGYAILFRAHYLVANSFDFSKYEGFVYDVSNVEDINTLYLASDMMITDYSSSLFDYAILERPMFFYMYDLADYQNDLRGFYMDPSELPGPVEEQIEGIARDILETPETWAPDEKYLAFNRKFNDLNDGEAAKRFAETVFSDHGESH